MSLIRLQDVSVRFDNTQILREAFFRLEAGDRVGLIGKNGSGKTTILKLVLDQVAPDTGTVTLEPGTKVGYFSQFSELDGDATILEVLDALFSEIKAVEAELAAIDAAIAADPAETELHRLIGRRFPSSGGRSAPGAHRLLPQRTAPPRGGALGAAVSQGRDQIRWRVGDPGPTPEPLGMHWASTWAPGIPITPMPTFVPTSP